MSDRKPQPGDTVLVSFKDTVNADGKYSGWRRVLDGNATVEVVEPSRCRATEGVTGIECDLPKGHVIDVDHEGTHDPERASHDGVGYRLTVRWPWQQYDRDYSDVALPDWKRELIEEDYAKRQRREPRVFSSDGPEPPDDVNVLRDVNGGNFMPYLHRMPDGWKWSWRADHPGKPGSAETTSWATAARALHGDKLEVVS